MRIVGGRHRGRRLSAPRGQQTRPTADMVREALFSSLFDVEGWRVLDLYAGTGAVALEALSRGAALAVAVERARRALACLAANAAALGLEAGLQIRAQPVAAALAQLAESGAGFDLIFADPPYDVAVHALPPILAAAPALLGADGVVVLELRSGDPAPEGTEALERTRLRRYGEATLAYYARR